MENKNWIVQLSEKKPSPALTLGMVIAIMTMATVIPFMFFKMESLSNRLNTAYSDGTTSGRIAADSAWAPIVKAKNTELLEKDKIISGQGIQISAWIERYISSQNASAENQVRELKETIAGYKAEEQEAKRVRNRQKTIIKRGEEVVNKLQTITEQKNEN